MKILGLAGAIAFGATAAHAAVIVSFEAPGVQNTTFGLARRAVETFDAQSAGLGIPVNTSFAAIGVGSTWTQALILPADQFGGAGGTGNQAAVRSSGDLSITFTGTPLNYFGLWASALDAANTVAFYRGQTLIGSANLTAFPLPGSGYSCNPNSAFAGRNCNERYAFFNFQIVGGYDRAVIVQNGGGGFELDNITIGSVPEPASWAMLIAGFGLIGTVSRRQRRHVAA